VILPLAGLVESTLVGNKPSAGSQSVLSGASGIVRNVVSGKWDKRGSDAVLRFIKMATAIPTRTGEQTAEDLKVQARVVSGISCFIENLSLYPDINHTDLQDILGLTTGLLEMCFKHGKVKDAVLIAENLLPVSTSASPVEEVRSIVLNELGRMHAQLLRQMPSA
jgi:hypothetical protein